MALPAELGTKIRDYRLDSVLGQGGMGCVYAATHQLLGRQVAIKVLASELASSEEYVSRFESEARIVNGVRHPNIVDIHDFIKEAGRVAYVMEYVAGPSLGRFLRDGALSVRQAVNVTFQLASALEAVHAVGVVHRDLKPDNVLVLAGRETDLSAMPSVKILDFGIAKTNGEDVSHKTITGSMLGTPSYMAPEQVAAEPVSPATDVYALAELLYEMVAGHRLFTGDRMAILQQKLVGGPPELAWPEVPGWQILHALVREGLHARPEHRLSIADLVNGLNEVLSQQPDAPMRTPVPGASAQPYVPSYVPPVSRTPPPPVTSMRGEVVHTPVNMQSVIALPAPRSPLGRLALPLGAVLLIGGAVAAAFLIQQGRSPDNFIQAQPLPAAVSAPAEPVQARPAPALVEPRLAPAQVVAAPRPAAPPVVTPAPAPVAKKVTRRRRPSRVAKKAPPPQPAAPEAPPAAVKKTELVTW